MTKTTYHHKDLKNTLLLTGIRLINEQGVEAFSMRKLAIACEVSHMAPYKHFQDKEAFLKEITSHIEKEFYESLRITAQQYHDDPARCIYELGKTYVSFIGSHIDYLKFYFLGMHQHNITPNDIKQVSSESALGVFRDCTLRFLKTTNIAKEYYDDEVMLYWAIPMGFVTLYGFNIIQKDQDYLARIESIMKREVEIRINASR